MFDPDNLLLTQAPTGTIFVRCDGTIIVELYYYYPLRVTIYIYKGSGRGRLGAPRPPWRVRVECEEVFVLELSGTHELHTIN